MSNTNSATRPKYFIDPSIDIWALGLLSIFVAFYSLMMRDPQTTLNSPAQWAFYFSFLINYPHFAASYRLLYKNFFSDLKELGEKPLSIRFGFLWTAIFCPLALLIFSFIAVQNKSEANLIFLLQLMYFTVGWHYVKQTFGIGLLASSFQKFHFKTLERNALKASLLSLWLLQWANSNLGSREYNYYGLKYLTLDLPPVLVTIFWILFSVGALLFFGLLLKRYLDSGEKPPMVFFVVIASMYVWYIPFFYHALFFLWLPLLHSLQYLVISHAYEQRKIAETTAREPEPRKQRYLWFWKNARYFIVIFILGAFGFEILPKILDLAFPPPMAGISVFFLLAALFINIHHYFIDSWIWRRHYRDHLQIFHSESH